MYFKDAVKKCIEKLMCYLKIILISCTSFSKTKIKLYLVIITITLFVNYYDIQLFMSNLVFNDKNVGHIKQVYT